MSDNSAIDHENEADSQPCDDSQPRTRWRIDLSLQILIALILGICCGVFFGDLCGSLSVIGNAFVGLLRMTVLPYILITLTASLGRLTLQNSGRLAAIGGIVLCLLWISCLAVIWMLAASFPVWTSGSFFSTALIEHPAHHDLLAFFIPANIFESLTHNQVPAVVVFAICCGAALAKAQNRAIVLEQLDVLAEVLMRISKSITKLAPIGIFAIAASTAGTVSMAEIARLQAYLIAYTAGTLFLGFIALPMLITTLTPLTYRQVMFVVKEPMLTAFATGKLIVVLPMLIENTERLFETELKIDDKDESPAIDLLYGMAYPFPHVGKLLSMLFIPFAAWFLGSPLKQSDYPVFLGSGLFSFFGGPIVAIPFLLDQMQIPHDMFQLFLVSGVLGERLGDAVGAMHLCALTTISIFGFNRALSFNAMKLLRYAVLVIGVGSLTLIALRIVDYKVITVAEDRIDIIERMQLLDEPVESVVITSGAPNPAPLLEGESVLQRVRRRGVLRVGYNDDKLPFVFLNDRNRLIGYDVDMAHALARDLGVTIEHVRYSQATLVQQLDDDHFDVVMSGLVGTLERAQEMQHTKSYMDVNLALVTPDFRASDFKTLKNILMQDNLQIGFVDLSNGIIDRFRSALPNARLIEIDNNRSYFLKRHPNLDALLISAESGSAYTLMHSNFEVVIPDELKVKQPLFYAVANRDAELRDFLEHWMTLRQKDGTSQEYYDHWVLGKTNGNTERRWSIIRDVLHWVE